MAMNPRLLKPRATGFDPRSVSGLALWLDAADSSTITLSAGVSEWRTRVAGSTIKATQAAGNNQPAYQTTQQNGKNALYFDGTNDSLNLGDLSATFPTAATLLAAFRPDSDTEYALIRTSNNSAFWAYPTARTYIGTFKGTRLNNVASATMPTNANSVVSITSSASAYRVYVNNAIAHDVAADYLAGTSHVIGSNDLGTFYKGWVYELIYYSRELSASELTRAYRYIRGKWGI
jgi:hypothetical protein